MTVKCPNCFSPITDQVRAFGCKQCPMVPDLAISRFYGDLTPEGGPRLQGCPTVVVEKPEKARFYRPPTSQVHRCGSEMVPLCPSCHFPLPAGWLEGRSVCVAIAGARATGKSVYIGVLKRALEAWATERGGALAFADRDSQMIYQQNFEEPLFAALNLPPATMPGHLSDAYQRRPISLSLGRINGKNTFVAIRDVAGEDLEASRELAMFSSFRNADLVLFLFDPLRVEQVAAGLRGLIPPPGEGSTADPAEVLTTLLRFMGPNPPSLALVVSKIDTIQAFVHYPDHALGKAMSNKGSALLRAENSPGVLHEETRSLLLALGASSIVNQVENPTMARRYHHRYFVTSSLGSPPEGNKQSVYGIAPFRVLDPLLWAMSMAGIISERDLRGADR